MNLFQPNYMNMAAFKKHWLWFFVWGLALVALGLVALYNVVATTVASIIVLGVVILAAGVVVLLNTFTFWWGQWGGFWLHLLMAVLYIAAGYMLINTPIAGSISITLLLGVLYIVVGMARIILSTSTGVPRGKWVLFNGIVTLLLGLLIITNWPASSLYIIGIFVGVDLLFFGWSYMMTSLAARSVA